MTGNAVQAWVLLRAGNEEKKGGKEAGRTWEEYGGRGNEDGKRASPSAALTQVGKLHYYDKAPTAP